MKTSINFTNATKRHTLIMFVSLFAITFCMYACNESTWSDSFANVAKGNSEVSKDQLKLQFGYAFAKVLAENKDARDIIKNEAIKKIDFDYDVLYTMIKDQTVQTGETIEESMLDYISKDTLNAIIRKILTLTIFVPELPEHIFSAETWDTENVIPEIAIRLTDSYSVPILDNDGNKEICEVDEIPMFPVVVIKENERITSIANLNTKASPNGLLRKYDLTFSDEIFNNISTKAPSTRTYNSTTSSSQSNKGVVKMDSRFEKVAKAYDLCKDNFGWQRDYIYYNISATSTNGTFVYDYKEYIWAFELLGDAVNAYDKIGDQNDPRPINNGARIPTWTDGEFEFLVRIQLASSNGVGNEISKSFRAKPQDLFSFSLERYPRGESPKGCRFSKYHIMETKTHILPIPIPLIEWNLQDYSTSMRITLEEADLNQVTTSTTTTSTDFAANFEYGSKIGLKFGASGKVTKTVGMQITTTQGNDMLGDVIINFGDNIITDTSILPLKNNSFNPKIREGDRSQEAINSASYDYYPKMNNGYYTSWYRIYIAPSSFN